MTRGKTGSIAAVLTSVVIGLPVAFVLLLSGDGPCALAGDAPGPSAAAQNGIPANYLALYQAAGQQFGVPWTLLAGIGSIETDHGRSSAAGVQSGVNFAGCCAGPMQFSILGAGGGTWGAYGIDGDRDGRENVYDPRDAIPAAANYLKASGAPGDLQRAIFAYNHSEAYVQQVLAKMREYAANAPAGPAGPAGPRERSARNASDTAPVGGCADLGGLPSGGSGTFAVTPDANLPGRPLTAAMTAFIGHMAAFYNGRLVVTAGTNHDQFTIGGNVSDHFTGNAVDFGMVLNHGTDDGPVGDRIAAAAFLAAGLPRDEAAARASAGGTQTIVSNGLRIQIIWKIDTPQVGNHHDHVHVGVGPGRMNAPRRHVYAKSTGGDPRPHVPRPRHAVDVPTPRTRQETTAAGDDVDPGRFRAHLTRPRHRRLPSDERTHPCPPVDGTHCPSLCRSQSRIRARRAPRAPAARGVHTTLHCGTAGESTATALRTRGPASSAKAEPTAHGTRPPCVDQACPATRNPPRQVVPPAPGLSTNSRSRLTARTAASNGIGWALRAR